MQPCEDWLTASDLAECETTAADELDLDSLAHLISILMYRLSGSQFTGICDPETVQPYYRRRCSCTPECPCDREFLILKGPIVDVEYVLLDGVELVLDVDYRISGKRRLQRLGARWPCPNSLTTPGRLEITYTHGTEIPEEGVYVARLLGCQMVRSLLNLPCDLPFKATSITRSGVSVALDNQELILSEGRTGVPEVDAWLQTINPRNRRRRAAIFRADDNRRMAHLHTPAAPTGEWDRIQGDDWQWEFETDSDVSSWSDLVVVLRDGPSTAATVIASTDDATVDVSGTDFGTGVIQWLIPDSVTTGIAPGGYWLEVSATVPSAGGNTTILPARRVRVRAQVAA